MKKKIGLILGSGQLAGYCVKKLISIGHELVIVRLPCCQLKIKKNLDCFDMKYEEIDNMFDFLKREKITDLVLIGYVKRPYISLSNVTAASQKIINEIFSALNKGDEKIFKVIYQILIKQKFHVLKVQELIPELTVRSGRYGPSFKENQLNRNVKPGIIAFKKYSKLDVGQSLIFHNGHCLGMETITGTDEMIKALISYRRNKEKKTNDASVGGVLIKGSKPNQLLEIDTPVVGPDTIKLAKKANLEGIVIESKRVILFNKKVVFDLLENYKMFLVVINFLNKDTEC